MLTGNFIMEAIVGIYGVIGDYVTPLITIGIIIGISHMGIKSGLIINLRQGSYQDLKLHKDQEYK